jgi:histidyl-tRNA synthetase
MKVKPALLRGFDQEYLPQEQLQFNALVDLIRSNFERFGFLPLETPSAERAEVLTSKGGVEKEIYALRRLAADPDDEAAAKGALRFDLTVPLARFVAMHERELAFPFRRYQIQRVWRGETPQARKGRFREFYQCDIDIIGREKLSYLAEAEIPSVIYNIFREMKIGDFRIRINNRKVLRGLIGRFGIPEDKAAPVLRALDKIEKEEAGRILDELAREGVAMAAAKDLYGLMSGKRSTDETLKLLAGLSGGSAVLDAGLDESRRIVTAIRDFGVPDSAFAVDLGIVRGLDYYTGTIYETTLVNHPEVGSVCSGGRYDDLASYFTDTKLPGVGISIGLTRLFAKLKDAGLLQPLRRTPAEVLVVTMEGQEFRRYQEMAAALRAAGVNTEVYLEPAKLKKQLEYAEKKGFRVALIAGEAEFAARKVQVKNLATRSASDCGADDLVGAVKDLLKQPMEAKSG